MNDIIKINYEDPNRPAVSGRELHEFLEVKTAYKDWFPRMCEYGFSEDADFNPLNFEQVRFEGGRQVSRTITDHVISIDMAKELCMLQRTERGKQARQYFIQIEKAWNSPEQVMSRALKLADQELLKLRTNNSALSVQNQIMQPKADYFDELVERNTLTNFRETAKQLGIKQKVFIGWLIAHKYVYRDKRGHLMPYANKGSDLFEIKECFNEKTQWAGTQTLVTPKGARDISDAVSGILMEFETLMTARNR